MHPVVNNGLGSPQDTQVISTTQYHELGTRGELAGNVWRYACSTGAAALTRGEVIVNEEITVDVNLATTTAALVVGSTSVTGITLGTAALTANQYADGWIMVVDGGGEGTYYRIKSHDAGTASSADFTLVLYDPIVVASDANTEVTLLENKYRGLQQSNTDNADVVVGVANVTVPIGSTTPQYFWAQTKGYCPAFVVGTPAVGSPLMISDTTAGMFELRAEADPDPAVAEMVTVGITGEVQVVNLKIE